MPSKFTDDRGAILMITRNNIHLSKLALKSAKAQSVPVDIMVIDNQSTDGTVPWLTTSSNVFSVFNQKQESLSACWNYGLDRLFKYGYNEVLVINNDVELNPYTYSALKSMKRQFVTAVSVDNIAQLMGYNSLVSPVNTRPHPDFSCFMIRRDTYKKVGDFDESYYPAFCEDADYHIRMHRAGIEAVCVDLPFLHHGSATVKNCDESERLKIQRGADANRKRFKAKYGAEVGSPEYYALFK